ncbi:mitochondrial inner membrane protease ATP23 homolog [Lingula anatina]|uniref:Mitochondrial inner membrane protease ATP23 n=1 Tax=Lingula anatina TaxID=7574 RepID=A0A1S3K2S9_LINAN|nr:mitochondrial inner membrane protease ATP23 homolog [Lingula anatina]|eukprot:XP_013416827.1 mitochondrial inner membrane protease ATP23 homolog [Lingula anatina]
MAKKADSDAELEELRRHVVGDMTTSTPEVADQHVRSKAPYVNPVFFNVTKTWAPATVMIWTSWHRRCEKEIVRCVREDPLIKTVLTAMEKKGCPVDLLRHVVCENCHYPGILTRDYGFFDREINQIYLCANQVQNKQIRHVFLRELIVAYDHCRAKIDVTSVTQEACTEVRAANLSGECTSLRKMWKSYPLTTLGKINGMHKECVRKRAVDALQKSFSGKPRRELRAAVDQVFERCYNDLDPLGRRPRRGSAADAANAYTDSQFMNH